MGWDNNSPWSHLDLQRGGVVPWGGVSKSVASQPASEGLSKRQLAGLQVPLRHRPPPTQPGHHRLSAGVMQEASRFKNTHQRTGLGFVSKKSRRARKGSRGRWTGLMSKIPTPADPRLSIRLSGLNLAQAPTRLFSFSMNRHEHQAHLNSLVGEGRALSIVKKCCKNK